MDTIRDLLASINAQLRERMANPLAGAFALSWAVANFRLFVILLGDGKFQEKLLAINQLFGGMSPDEQFLRWFVLPTVAAIAYVYVYPFISRAVMQFHRKSQNELKALAMQLDEERPVDKAELKRIVDGHNARVSSLEDVRDGLRDRLRTTEERLRAREAEIATLQERLDRPAPSTALGGALYLSPPSPPEESSGQAHIHADLKESSVIAPGGPLQSSAGIVRNLMQEPSTLQGLGLGDRAKNLLLNGAASLRHLQLLAHLVREAQRDSAGITDTGQFETWRETIRDLVTVELIASTAAGLQLKPAASVLLDRLRSKGLDVD